ncbi:hypothetical protein NMY22_g8371 [Coprinellus aureogranulatus]|nr:hypothetical protein NMY22_g8371 [Coprinellus aureogranulatus]
MPWCQRWTYMQILEMRVGAIKLLRAISRHTNITRFEDSWWRYWVATYGLPVPEDWDEVRDYDEFIEDYRSLVFRGIRWFAFRGRYGPSNAMARFRRIREIRDALINDIGRIQAARISVDTIFGGNYYTPLYFPTSGRAVVYRNTRRRRL